MAKLRKEVDFKMGSLLVPIGLISRPLQNLARPAKLPDKKSGKSKTRPGIVNVRLIEAWDLCQKTDGSLPDPFVKFKLGNLRYKSKTKQKTLNPIWKEQFDLLLFEDESTILEISVRSDEIGSREWVIGECSVDLNLYTAETTHHIALPLTNNNGVIHFLVSLLCTNSPKDGPALMNRRTDIARDFSYWRTFRNLSRVGWLEVTVLRAAGLATSDLGGTSDPFCVVEMGNDRLRTSTVYKTLNPEWNKTLSLIIKDIHLPIEVTLWDENKLKKVEFLGKITLHLLQLKRRETVWYQLKDETLHGKKKGAIQLYIDYVYNPVRAAIRTFTPKEKIHMTADPKFKVSIMKNNIERCRKVVKNLQDAVKYVNSCLDWESKPRSLFALAVYIVCVLFMELYMIPLVIVFLLLHSLIVTNNKSAQAENEELIVEDDDDDLESRDEKRSIVEKLQSIHEVCLAVQELLDVVATYVERLGNLIFWKVPWLTSLGMVIFFVVTIVLYFVPTRILLLVWGIRKFSKKLLDPNYVETNEIIDYLSRVPSDKELMMVRELPLDPIVQSTKKKTEAAA